MSNKNEQLLLQNQLCFPLYALSRLTTKLYGPILDNFNITYPQYLVLLVLWERDKQTVSEISERLILESNTLTPLLKRMEQKELVKRVRSTKDERRVFISLTEKGKELKTDAACIPQRILESFSTEEMNVNQVQEFQKTLHLLLDGFKQQIGNQKNEN